MEERYYLMRLVAHRPTFASDMSESEQETMRQHVMYWTRHAQEGLALLFGPVIDPRESWGFAVVKVQSEEQAAALCANDPATSIGRHELLPIPQLIFGSAFVPAHGAAGTGVAAD